MKQLIGRKSKYDTILIIRGGKTKKKILASSADKAAEQLAEEFISTSSEKIIWRGLFKFQIRRALTNKLFGNFIQQK